MIINMDAIEGLKQIPSKSTDIVLVDPPYNIGKDFGNSKYKMEMEEYVGWCKEWMRESVRILKDTGTIYIYGFSEILAHISVNMEIPHRWLIWHYTNRTVPSSRFWQRSHESIIVGWKTEGRIFNRDDVREPYTDIFIKGYSAKGGKKPRTRPPTKGRFQGKKTTEYKVNDLGALPRDVLKIPAMAGSSGASERYFWCEECSQAYSPKDKKAHKASFPKHKVIKHPTQKPQSLTRKLFMAAQPVSGGSVVVPFVGSGSEVAVAKQMGLDYIGFELNEKYIKIANKMLEDIT